MMRKRFVLVEVAALIVVGICLAGCGPQGMRQAPFLFPIPADLDGIAGVQSKVYRISVLFHDLSFGMQRGEVIEEMGDPKEVMSSAAEFGRLGVSSTASILAWQRGSVMVYLVLEDTNGVLSRVFFADRESGVVTERLVPSSLLSEVMVSRGMSQMQVLVLLGKPGEVEMQLPDSPDHYSFTYHCDEGSGNALRITLSRSTRRVVRVVSIAWI